MITSLILLICGAGWRATPPVPLQERTPSVEAVMPSTGDVHENLLRFSIRFSQPTDETVLKHLTLIDEDGRPILDPFLNQELWSPDGRTLTVLFGPGRVKTGLIAHDTMGRPLHAGEHVLLEFDGKEVVRWRVTPEWIHPILPETWKIIPPPAGSRKPLIVKLTTPIDGMDASYILVAQHHVPLTGTSSLDSGETVWSFIPDHAWPRGRLVLLIHPHLEDPYGNEVHSSFEANEAVASHSEKTPTAIPFSVH